MSLYRERPPTVEASQATARRVVSTLDGQVVIAVGDYLVRGANGQCSIVPQLVFEQRYESVLSA